MKKFGILVALVAGFVLTANTASAQVFGRGCNSGGSSCSGGRVFHGNVFHGGGLFHHHSAPACGQVVYSQPTYTTCGGAPVYYSSGCGQVVYGTPVYSQPITLPAPSSTYVPPTYGGSPKVVPGPVVVPAPVVEPKQPFTLPAPSSKQPPR